MGMVIFNICNLVNFKCYVINEYITRVLARI